MVLRVPQEAQRLLRQGDPQAAELRVVRGAYRPLCKAEQEDKPLAAGAARAVCPPGARVGVVAGRRVGGLALAMQGQRSALRAIIVVTRTAPQASQSPGRLVMARGIGEKTFCARGTVLPIRAV